MTITKAFALLCSKIEVFEAQYSTHSDAMYEELCTGAREGTPELCTWMDLVYLQDRFVHRSEHSPVQEWARTQK